MGLFKKVFGGMKERMNAVDNLTQAINNGDVEINVKSNGTENGDAKGDKRGFLNGFKDRMNAVDNLTKSINDSKKKN